MAEGAVRTYYADITGSADGLVRAAGEGEAAGARLESQYGKVSGSMASVGAASKTHIGGTSVEQASLLEKGVGKIDSAIKNVVGSVVQMGAQFGAMAGIAGGVGFLAVGVKDAMDFNQALTLIQTQAGDTTDSIYSLSNELTQLAPQVGQTPEALATGFYHLASAGYVGAQGLDILTQSAKLADVGQADLETTTDAVVSAMKSGVPGIQSASDAVAVLNAIVGSGNMKMQDLADAMASGLLPVAGTFGVSIQSVGAALSFMTDQGVPAADAATKLRMSMSLLAAPSAQATKLLTDAGLAASDAADQTSAMQQAFEAAHVTTTQMATDLQKPDGFVVALQDLKTNMDNAGVSAQEQDAVISRAFGGGRSGAAIIDMYHNLDQVSTKFGQINAGANQFGNDWATQSAQASQRLADLKAGFEAAAISVGEGLLPTITDLGYWFSTHEGQIQSVAKTVGTDLGTAFQDVGGFITNDFWPPLHTAIDFIGQNLDAVKTFGEVIGSLYLANKGVSLVGGLYGDLQKLLGAAGKVTGLGGAGGLPVQHVWVDNPGFGGAAAAPGGAAAAEEGAGGAATGGVLARLAGVSGGTALTMASLGIMNTSDVDTTSPSFQNMLKTDQAQADEAAAAQKSADVSQQVAQLWSERKDVFKTDLLSIDTYLSDVMSNSGTQAQLAGEIVDLWQHHQISSATDLQAVIDAWNRGVTSSQSIAALLDTIHESTALADLHGQAFSNAIGYLAQNAGVSTGEILGDYVQTAAFAAEMQREQQDLNNRIADLANNIPSSIYDTATGGGRGYLGGAYATGGVVSAAATGGMQSGVISAGEHGPELAVLPSGFRGRVPAGTDVLTNHGMLGFDMGGGFGGGVDNSITITGPIHIHGVDDPAAFFEAVQKEALLRAANQGQQIFGRFR